MKVPILMNLRIPNFRNSIRDRGPSTDLKIHGLLLGTVNLENRSGETGLQSGEPGQQNGFESLHFLPSLIVDDFPLQETFQMDPFPFFPPSVTHVAS